VELAAEAELVDERQQIVIAAADEVVNRSIGWPSRRKELARPPKSGAASSRTTRWPARARS
jgi:hypothetical protein